MILHVAPEGTVELKEPGDFKNFKIAVAKPGASPAFIAGALKGIAALEADGKTAWVSQDALRRWQGREQPADWLAAFDRMVESVRRFGWVRDSDKSVRAHVEVAG
ncbi:MAG TPA: hypothetical protein VFA22_07480 [Stellaceae bacterium]|nr:hypothetical protein [Stellaceae bacterium]